MKNSKDAKDLMVSLIPLAMTFGCAICIVIGMFFEQSFLFTAIFGTLIGFLIGVISYVIYSMNKKV